MPSAKLLTNFFASFANSPYKLAIGLTLFIFGFSAIIVGAWHLWQVTQVPVCSMDCPVLPDATLSATLCQMSSSSLPTKSLQIDVSGAVVRPGVYEVSAGARLAEAIKLAGGFSQDADKRYLAEKINLASNLVDSQKVFIPPEGYVWQNSQTEDNLSGKNAHEGSVSSNSSNANSCISVNSASQKELMDLVGVGEVRSANIISNRPYTSLIELLDKKVLTEKIMSDNQQLLCL